MQNLILNDRHQRMPRHRCIAIRRVLSCDSGRYHHGKRLVYCYCTRKDRHCGKRAVDALVETCGFDCRSPASALRYANLCGIAVSFSCFRLPCCSTCARHLRGVRLHLRTYQCMHMGPDQHSDDHSNPKLNTRSHNEPFFPNKNTTLWYDISSS